MDNQDKWYYTIGGKETIGPVSLNDMREAARLGKITGETPVWKSSFGNEWKRAGEISELRSLWREAENIRLKEVAKTQLTVYGVGTSVRNSISWMKKVLFQPFSFLAWMGILCCIWLSFLSPSTSFIDNQTFKSSILASHNFSESVTAFVLSLVVGLKTIFTPKTMPAWSFAMAFSCFVTAFINVKGRLIFLNKVFIPSQSFAIGWQKTVGRTRSLVIVYTFLFILWNLTLATSLFQILLVSGFFDDSSQLTTSTIVNALSGGPALSWLIGGTAFLLLITFIRSFFFHFVEPLVYRFSIPALVALKMVLRELYNHFGYFCRFYLVILIYRCIWAFVLIILFLALSFIFGSSATSFSPGQYVFISFFFLSQFLLYFIWNLVLLPLHYFFRVLGTQFLR